MEYSDYDDDNYTYIKSDHKSDGHTHRANLRGKLGVSDYMVNVVRPYNMKEIPVTQMDSMIQINNPYRRDSSLRKGYLFEQFISKIEEIAESKKVRYQKHDNMISTHYYVPVTGFISNPNKKIYPCSNTSHDFNQYSFAKERFIVIGSNRYSTLYSYKKVRDSYVKLAMVDINDQDFYSDNEQKYLSTSTLVRTNYIQLKYHHDISINSLVVYPEKLIFESIHGDGMNCAAKGCNKSKHTINVLKNNPGYITRFTLYYRSSKTQGKWVNHGNYTGCTNMFTPVKVSFDTISVNEIRIVPIHFVNKFDKVKIWAVGETSWSKPIESGSITVEYVVKTPRDGVYVQSKICDNYHYINREYKEWQNRNKDRIKPRFGSAKIKMHDDCYDFSNFSDND
jgi:hypothetical protein